MSTKPFNPSLSCEYKNALANYQKFLKGIDNQLEELRMETQVESYKDWSILGSSDELKSWYLDQQESCSMSVEEIPLKECREWVVDEESGTVRHRSGDFFYVQGVRIAQSGEREVGAGGWDQPILVQVGFDGGLLGVLRKRFEGIPHYLIEAKAEPGNPDRVQISPTLQATFSNLKMAHKGRKPHFSSYFEDPQAHNCKVLFDQWMSEDGGRLYLKRNRGLLIEVDDNFDDENLPSTFRWVSLYQLKSLIKENSWVSPHVRGIISHL